MLKVKNISTGYGKKQVIFDVTFEIKEREIALLIGSNGSGKSTLLKSIFGLVPPWSGNVFFDGQDITTFKPEDMLAKKLMYVPQKENFFDNLTAKENLEVSGLTMNNQALFQERYTTILQKLPMLNSLLNQSSRTMSGGERQILIIAMALLHQPKLILLDEPFAGLHPSIAKQTLSLLKSIKSTQNTSFLIVEHDLKTSLTFANRVIGLKLGSLCFNYAKKHNFTPEQLNKIFL